MGRKRRRDVNGLILTGCTGCAHVRRCLSVGVPLYGTSPIRCDCHETYGAIMGTEPGTSKNPISASRIFRTMRYRRLELMLAHFEDT